MLSMLTTNEQVVKIILKMDKWLIGYQLNNYLIIWLYIYFIILPFGYLATCKKLLGEFSDLKNN